MTVKTYSLPLPWAGFLVSEWIEPYQGWLVADWPAETNQSNAARLAELVRDYTAFFVRETAAALKAAVFAAPDEKRLRNLFERLMALKNLLEEERRKENGHI